MPAEVIARVNTIGARQKMPTKLTYANRYGNEIEDTLNEFNVESSDDDSSYTTSDTNSNSDSDDDNNYTITDMSDNESNDSDDDNDNDNVMPPNNEDNLPPPPDNMDPNPNIKLTPYQKRYIIFNEQQSYPTPIPEINTGVLIVPPVSNIPPTFIPNSVNNILHKNDNNTGVEIHTKGVEEGVEE